MEDAEYQRMAEVEDRMWWYRNLHHNLLAVTASIAGKPLAVSLAGKRVLDAGCGTGELLRRLETAAPHAELRGIDISERAVAFARTKTRAEIDTGSVDTLPYPDASFDLVTSADVLYHRLVDQERAISEMRRCLKPGGLLVVNLPAYEWLRSYHDEHVGGARRYARGATIRLFASLGFETCRCGYWNTVFFPLMAAKRKLLPGGAEGSDVALMPAPLEAAFHAATGIERGLLRAGILMPFGGSLIWAGTRRDKPE
jgi:SAM-dependent methyltransferase